MTDRAAGETFSFYGGKAVLKKRMYGTAPSFKRVDGKETILSVTRCTGKLDKSKALIPWACGLVAGSITSEVESSKSETFHRDEVLMMVREALLAPDRAKDAGAQTGDLIHTFAHDFAKAQIEGTARPTIDHLNPEIDAEQKALNGISAFLDWYNANDVEFLEMEKLVYYNSLLAGDTSVDEALIEFYGFLDLKARVNSKKATVDYKSSKGIYNEQRYQVAGYEKADSQTDPSDIGLIVNFNKITGELMTKELPRAELTLDYGAFLGLHATAERERVLEREYKDSKKATV